jgi:hypothetical protein
LNSKFKIFFKIEQILPDPFLESQINTIIRKMNINKKDKKKYLLETKDKNDKIDLIRERIMLKSKERRKNLKEKRKNEIKVKHESESKCGRKKISDTSNRIHDKYSPDNLIGKIKNMIKNH